MKTIHLALASAAIILSGSIAYAEPNHSDPTTKKVNGDAPGDTAPLSGGQSSSAPLDSANFPPPGGATMGAGPNPMETGPIDANKASKK